MKTRGVVQDFIKSRRARGLSSKTIAWYQGLLSLFSRTNPELPEDPAAIETFLGALQTSDETRHAYYRVLRAFYRWTSQRRGVNNPMLQIAAPKRLRKTPYSLTRAEIGWLLASPLSPRDRALVELLIDTGIRTTEAIRLTRDDILEETIMVSGKTGQREVPISPEVKQELLALGNSPIFKGTQGPITRSGAYRIIRLAFKAAGIPAKKWGPHTLRHTFGRHYILAGGDLVSLQRILGHTDIKTTRIYAELDLRDITYQHHRFTPLKIGQVPSVKGGGF